MLPDLALMQSSETDPLYLPPLPQKTSRSSERKKEKHTHTRDECLCSSETK